MSEDFWMDVMRGEAATRDEETAYREAVALIGAGVNLARAGRTAAGYDEYTLRNLARIVIANWKHIDPKQAWWTITMTEKYEDIWKMRDLLDVMKDPRIVSGAELDRLIAASNNADRLRDGIQKVIDGTYGREKHFKTKHDTCPHGQFSWQSCDPCVDEYLASLIA